MSTRHFLWHSRIRMSWQSNKLLTPWNCCLRYAWRTEKCWQNIVKCRTSLFAMLGQAFAYKCMLSPLAQVHIWRTCNLPVLLSGLSALPIRPTNIRALETFHKKILRGFLKLSQASPIPALHFLLGELPVEWVLHLRTMGLFYNLWSNPQVSVHSTVKYILKMWRSKSTTGSNHLKLISQQ